MVTVNLKFWQLYNIVSTAIRNSFTMSGVTWKQHRWRHIPTWIEWTRQQYSRQKDGKIFIIFLLKLKKKKNEKKRNIEICR